MFSKVLTIAFLTVMLFNFGVLAMTKTGPAGSIKGRVIDSATKEHLIGVNVFLQDTNLGDATDDRGEFQITAVPVGGYVIRFSYIGYKPKMIADVVIHSGRTTRVNAQMVMAPVELDGVVVTGGYFQEIESQPTSSVSFSNEEIRRAAGSAGDVSRIIMSLPSIAKVDDQSNSLVVRGGNPIENTHYIDNIEVANINHFPSQGASGGPIGMINVDLIQDVDFYTGGFSAAYGDKLSSVMELKLREGDREHLHGELNVDFAGFGGIAEGPLPGNGSWLVSLRRSYLDYLVKAVDVGATVAPRFGDFQGKMVYDLGTEHKLTLLTVMANDKMKSDQQQAIENDMVVYGDQDITQNTVGLNWRMLWRGNGYSNTSISYASNKYDEDFNETGTNEQLVQNGSHEQAFSIRNSNNYFFNDRHNIEFGLDLKHLRGGYDNLYAGYTDAFGNEVAALQLDNKIDINQVGGFVSYTITPVNRLTATIGLRSDYFSYNARVYMSPRFSLSYNLSGQTSVSLAAGLFRQNLPLLLLATSPGNRDLNQPAASHLVLRFEHRLTENSRFTFEVYQKQYRNFPIDRNQPGLFLLDELYFRDAFFFNYEQLLDEGKAYSRGVEAMLQKKLARNFYGLVSVAYFRTRYQGLDDAWYDRIFDNRFLFSAEGGYKPNNKWEFSARWLYAGGRPYTPFNLTASASLNRSVLDENRINGDRYPAYHSLNLRADRRFYFSGSSMVVYISIWNAYNRKNVAAHFWNQIDNKPATIYQWSMLPIFGVEYKF